MVYGSTSHLVSAHMKNKHKETIERITRLGITTFAKKVFVGLCPSLLRDQERGHCTTSLGSKSGLSASISKYLY